MRIYKSVGNNDSATLIRRVSSSFDQSQRCERPALASKQAALLRGSYRRERTPAYWQLCSWRVARFLRKFVRWGLRSVKRYDLRCPRRDQGGRRQDVARSYVDAGVILPRSTD